MAIAFDAKSSGIQNTASSTLTISHTCTGSNLLLVVNWQQDVSDTVTGVTYNGVAMSNFKTVAAGATNIGMFYLIAPATGTHNIVLTRGGTSGTLEAECASYSGCADYFVDAFVSGNSTANPTTSSITTIANNCWLVGNMYSNDTTLSSGTNMALRQAGADANRGLMDSNGAIASAGATSISWNWSTSPSAGAFIVASFAPAGTTSPRYWVGGTGNWNTTTMTNWSNASGGTGGFPPPTVSQDATFDGNSGGGTATISADVSCSGLTMTGYTGTLAGSNALTLYSNLTLGSGITNSYTGAITFAATSSGKTITTAGKTIGSNITFNGSGGGWTLQDTLTCSQSITLTAGTLASGNNNIVLTGTGTAWSGNGGSFTPGIGTITFNNASSSSKTFSGGGLTYYNLYLTGAGTGTFIIAGSNTFNDFKCDTPPHTIQFTAGTTQTLNTFTVNGTAGNLMTLQSTVSGNLWYLHKSPAGQVSCDYLSLQDSYVS